jgi:sec-independent protein translocase protein TatA
MNIQPLAFIQNLRGPELALIVLVILLLFGAKRLPELFKSFGKSIKEFKKATSETEEEPTHAPRSQNKQVKDDADTKAPSKDA